jgi:Tol biopolymer transport system component
VSEGEGGSTCQLTNSMFVSTSHNGLVSSRYRDMKRLFIITILVCMVYISYGSRIESEWSEPEKLNRLEIGTVQYYPCINHDGSKLYFTARSAPGGYGQDDIWVSDFDSRNRIWRTPKNVGSNINTLERELSPSISSDGTKLYFISYGRPGGYGSYDIWVSTWQDSMWGPAENLGPNINTRGIEWTVFIAPDDTTLYFTSEGHPDSWEMDIYVSHFVEGQWGVATKVENVNWYSADESPSITSDGRQLYFASWEIDFTGGNYGGADIFVSNREEDHWGEPINVGLPINSETWDLSPSISCDGNTLYFASRREGGNYSLDHLFVSRRITGIEEDVDETIAPTCHFLFQSYPNPFNTSTAIEYQLSIDRPTIVVLKIHNLLGQEVKTLVNEKQSAGYYTVWWNGKDKLNRELPSGIYLYHLSTSDYSTVKKMILLH